MLLMQVHGVFTLVKFLEAHQKLSPFLDSLALSQTRGIDVFNQLSREVVHVIALDQDPYMATVVERFRNLLPSLRGSNPQSFSLSFLLLESAFEARADFSEAYSRVPGFGWPLVLLGIWPKLQYVEEDPGSPYDRVELLRQLRDLVDRCLLVAPPQERCIVGSLAWVMDCTKEKSFMDSFKRPQDTKDFETVLSSAFLRLSTRPAGNIPGDLKYLSTMTAYALHCARAMDRYDICPQLLGTAYTRLWAELTFNPNDRHAVDNVVGYSVDLLGYTR